MNFATRIATGAVFLLACLSGAGGGCRRTRSKSRFRSARLWSAIPSSRSSVSLPCMTVTCTDALSGRESASSRRPPSRRDKHACDVATIAYVMGPEVSQARSTNGTFRVVRVLVLGVLTEQGMQASEPTPFYSAAPVVETEA